MAQDTEEIRDKIDRMYAKIEEISYYELLGIDSELEDLQVNEVATGKFRQLAKEWHVDRYDVEALGGEEYREKLQEIFSTINTAHQVLTDEDKKAEYDMELSGENTDIGSILNAENSFRKGQNMLSTGSYKGAHQQFQSACENNPDDIEYRAHFLYTDYLMLPKDEEGNPTDRARAKEIYDGLDEILDEIPDRGWLLAFLGVVAMGLKKYRDAQSLFSEALQMDPKNVIAKRQQRLLKMRRERGSKKGFFGQLMEKLNLS